MCRRGSDAVGVDGRMGGTAIYELVGMDGEPAPAWIGAYEEGLARYTRGEFAAAITYFEKADGARPGGDMPSQMLIERCREFVREPPPAEWDGTTALLSK